MFRISRTALINAPTDQVFASLADVNLHTKLHRSLDLEVAETSAGGPGIGQSVLLEGMYRDLPVSFRLEFTEITPTPACLTGNRRLTRPGISEHGAAAVSPH